MCSESHGKLTVFSVKAMLATMCGGKIVDKLRCKYILTELQSHMPYLSHLYLAKLSLFVFHPVKAVCK